MATRSKSLGPGAAPGPDRGHGRWEDAIAGLVRRAQAAGRVHADADPAETGMVLLGALQGGTVLAHLQRSEVPLASALDAVIGQLAA